MPLPYTYRAFYQTDFTAKKLFFELRKKFLVKKILDIEYYQNQISFIYNSFFFIGRAKVILDFSSKDGFHFEVVLENLLKVVVFLIVILAFIASGIWNLIFLSTAIIFIIYLLVIIDVHNTITDFFDKIIVFKETPEQISDEQLKWINQNDLCPACGEQLTEYDSFCPECGLNLRNRRKVKEQKVSRTGFNDFRIFYNYKSNISEEKNN